MLNSPREEQCARANTESNGKHQLFEFSAGEREDLKLHITVQYLACSMDTCRRLAQIHIYAKRTYFVLTLV